MSISKIGFANQKVDFDTFGSFCFGVRRIVIQLMPGCSQHLRDNILNKQLKLLLKEMLLDNQLKPPKDQILPQELYQLNLEIIERKSKNILAILI